ncbi:nuclear transport factor 2 family protein [Neisseria zalophi]|nr:nuclear transport factor 2 family protein [Neisseria zalophi]
MESAKDWAAMVREAEKKRIGYMIAGQFEKFAAMCSPSLRYVHSGGSVDGLSSFMEKVQSGLYDYQRIDYPIYEVRVLGGCVLVFAEFNADVLVGGQLKKLDNHAVSVWEIDGEDLKFAFYQATPKAK